MAVNGKQILVFIARRIWFFLAALLVLLAILVSVGRLAINELESYRPPLNEYVSELINARFQAEQLSGSWERLIPSITAENIKIYTGTVDSKPAITLSELTLDLNVVQSLLSWELIWHELRFGKAELTLQEDQQGRWGIAGMAMSGGSSGGSLLDVLFLSDHLEVEELQVTLAFYSGTTTTVDARQMVVESQGDFHRLKASLALDGRKESAKLVLEGTAASGGYSTFYGTGYLKLSQINFDGSISAMTKSWFPQLVQQIGEIETDLDAEFWLEFDGLDQFDWAGFVKAAELPVNWLADVEPVTGFQSEVTGWFRGGDSWGMRLQGVDFEWRDFEVEPFTVTYSQQMGSNWGQAELSLSRVNLATLNHLLLTTRLPPEKLLSVLEALNPEGILSNIHLSIDMQSGEPELFGRLNMRDVAVHSWKNAPASRQINGYAEFHSQGEDLQGLVELDSPDGFAMYYPKTYPDYMEHGSVKGQVRWRLDRENNAVTVSSGAIEVGGEEGKGKAYLYLDLPLDRSRPEQMFLLAGVRDTHSRYRDRYIPMTLNENLLGWLAEAPRDVSVSEVGFIWRGALRGDASGRTVQLHLDVADGELAFQPDWQPLKNLSARIDLDDAEFNGVIRQANIGNVEGLSGDVRLVGSASNNPPGLLIDATVKDDLGDAMAVLHQSPLSTRIAALEDWQFSGQAGLKLDLAIPLTSDKRNENYRVDVALQDAEMAHPEVGVSLEKLNGDLQYDLHKGLSAQTVDGVFWGKPLKVKVATAASDKGLLTSIAGNGVVTADALSGFLNLDAKLLKGSAAYTATLLLPLSGNTQHDQLTTPEAPQLSVSSNLKGMSIELPAPFGKSAEEAREVTSVIDFSDTVRIDTQMTSLVSNWLELERGQLVRGALAVNQPLGVLPPRGEFELSGRLPHLAIGDWQDVYQLWQVDGSNQDEAVLTPKVNLQVDQLDVGQITLNKVTAAGNYSGGQWQLNIDSDLAAGDLIVTPSADLPLTLALSRLSLPEGNGDADPLAEINPAELPAVNFSVQDFSIGEQHYGSAAFAMVPEADSVLIDNIQAKLQGLTLGDGGNPDALTSLRWQRQGDRHNTTFEGIFYARDIGDVLKQRGMARVIDSKAAYFRASLAWPDTPTAFSAATLQGALAMELKDGHFYKSPGGATNALMRTISLFNFANWARRLRLDFSDLLKKGMSYDSLRGGLTFDNGIMGFEPAMVVDMPSGRMKMLGTADLINEQIDAQLVTTLPVGTNLPWLAALAGGLPAAAGVYVTGKIFKKQVDQLSSIGYDISGSWNDPDVKVNKIFSDRLNKQPTNKAENAANPLEEGSQPAERKAE